MRINRSTLLLSEAHHGGKLGPMKKLFNIKMRSSRWNGDKNESQHISGAERISNEESLQIVIKDLIYRVINHEKGEADSINISIDRIDKEKIVYIPCVDIITIESETPDDGENYIIKFLKKINIDHMRAQEVLNIMDSNRDMRGAILLDLSSMKMIDSNNKRGFRATGMDWKDSIKENTEKKLDAYGLNNNHVKEALVLASKVIYPKGALAEICISDDPNYTTGYVSIKDQGYFRITNLKEIGSQKGGRIILFDSRYGNIDEYINFLENSITMVDTVPNIK